VLQDRYLDSSVAYQGAGRVLDPEDVRRLSLWAVGGLLPRLTVLLDLDPRVGRERRADRTKYDRLEAEDDAFHDRVRAAFLAAAAAEPDRFLVVDAAEPPEVVQERIRAALEPLLAEP
jgi:dTMP kinase